MTRASLWLASAGVWVGACRALGECKTIIREANEHNQGETQEGVENIELIGQILGKADDNV